MSDRMVAPSTASELTVGGRRVRYRVSGDGPTVVMLHGIGRSLEDWSEQHALLQQRFRVVSVDLAGFGGSEPLAEPCSLPAFAGFVEDFLDAGEVAGPVHLVGNSLGGAVAMQVAAQAPHRVTSLTLVDSAGFGREVSLTLRLLAIRPLARLLLRHPTWSGARQVERSIFHDPAFATDARIEHAHRLAHRPHAARVLLETARSLGTLRGVRPEWRQRLLGAVAELGIPVLVVWGSRDRILPAAHLNAAAARLPHARTHLFEDTGHMPQIERADAFSRLVTDFWRPLGEIPPQVRIGRREGPVATRIVPDRADTRDARLTWRWIQAGRSEHGAKRGGRLGPALHSGCNRALPGSGLALLSIWGLRLRARPRAGTTWPTRRQVSWLLRQKSSPPAAGQPSGGTGQDVEVPHQGS